MRRTNSIKRVIPFFVCLHETHPVPMTDFPQCLSSWGSFSAVNRICFHILYGKGTGFRNQTSAFRYEHVWEGKMATRSRILAWRIAWPEQPAGLQSTGSQRVGHGWSDWAEHENVMFLLWRFCFLEPKTVDIRRGLTVANMSGHWLAFFRNRCIYLAMLGLGCSTWKLCCHMPTSL